MVLASMPDASTLDNLAEMVDKIIAAPSVASLQATVAFVVMPTPITSYSPSPPALAAEVQYLHFEV